LTNALVDTSAFHVVIRNNIDVLIKELDFNMSGYVSDDSAQSLGQLLGAEIVIIGSITLVGDVYRLNAQALKTESGQILAAYGYDIQYNDSRIKGLIREADDYTPVKIIGTEPINRNSHNFIQLRDYAKFLIGGEFYVAIGRCNLYTVWSRRDSGTLLYKEATGETLITYVAIHVNPRTGEVLSIVVVNRIGRDVPETSELIGGISIDDYFKTKTWIEAIRYIQENDI
jgi:hypothetical protein